MATIFEPKDRNVIPRWRDFATTLELGELSESASTRSRVGLNVDLTNLETDWHRERTLSFAADLISAAVISGGSDVAREAAKHVLELDQHSVGDSLSLLARSVLDGQGSASQAAAVQTYSQEDLRRIVGDHRHRLLISPRNAILWVDLSLLYAVQGLVEKAKRAMIVAIGLEPDNRFVLRSAARMYIHFDEPDIAHRLLRRSNAIRFDPWIMAAELATATSAKFIPFSIDHAAKFLGRDTADPSETTELSTAFATIELEAGNTNKAKRHMRRGLRSPNENSLAQVRWLLRDLKGFLPDLNVTDLGVSRSFEAAAWEAHAKKDWTSAAANAVRWFRDQPFSSRPALVGSNIIAALLGDYDSAIKLANLGLVANKEDHPLYNMLAFAHASKGETAEAREALGQIKGTLSVKTEVTTTANYGLIAFREGLPEIGRVLYEAAFRKANTSNDEELIAGALTYWAREEILLGSDQAGQVLSRAREAVKAIGDRSIEAPFILGMMEQKYSRSKETKS